MAKILHTTHIKPDFHFTHKQIKEAADKWWLKDIDPKLRRIALKIFEGSQIDTRNAVIPLDIIFSKEHTFEQKNNIFKEAVRKLGNDVLTKTLKEAKIDPKEVDFLITTSCTGFMIPSVDAYMVNDLGLRGDIIRLPVTEMGCAGGTSALIYANNFLKANPGKIAAIVSLETPSVTFRPNDLNMENFVSAAIFADGAACTILGDTNEVKPQIVDENMYHFFDASYLMGYNLTNTGLKIVLDKDVPMKIEQEFENFFLPFLQRNNLKPEDIENYMFHPGGKKIINMVEKYITPYGKDISDSKEILRTHGNMSSATILHILERFQKKNIQKGEKGYMLAFGPGFMAQSLLLEWK